MRNNGQHTWTAAEDLQLLQMYTERVRPSERAKALGLSADAVRSRLTKLLRSRECDIPVFYDDPSHPMERGEKACIPPPSLPDSMRSERILFVPDTHVPYEDDFAWNIMLRAARAWKPYRIVVLGDLADFYSVSAHSKDPSRRQNLKWEIGEVNRRLDELDALGAEKKNFVEGNHENRLARHLADKAPEMFDMFDVPSLFRLAERGWTYTPYRQLLTIGKLKVTHDVKFAGSTAVTRTRDKVGGNVCIGHTHRMAIDYRGNISGSRHVGASFGWLGALKDIDYMHVADSAEWQHGFGIGHMLPDGDVHLHCVPIVDGRCVIDGVVVT